MRVNQINQYNKCRPLPQNQEISFKSIRLWSDVISHQTNFFRGDVDWDRIAEYIIERMPKDIHIFNYASSDGSEPYSLLLKLKEKAKYPLNGILPIKAFDISDKMVEKSNKGLIGIFESNDKPSTEKKLLKNHMQHFTKMPVTKYVDEWSHATDIFDDDLHVCYPPFKVSDELRKNVVFSLGDITKDFKKPIEDKPSVVLFRNAWRYLKDDEERACLANDLYKNLKQWSIVIIGQSEFDDGHNLFLEKAGFRPYVFLRGVYRKTT